MSQTFDLILVGPKHAGKTVFLTALANCASGAITMRGSESVATMKEYWKRLQEGETPSATAGVVMDLAMTYKQGVYNVDFDTFDYDGHFAETLSQTSDERRLIRERIGNADGVVVFMPFGEADQDTMKEMRAEIDTFINEMRATHADSQQVTIQLILAVSKWDKSPDFKAANEDEAAQAYIDSTELYGSIHKKLANYFKNVKVVPLSAYGHKCENDLPLPGRMAPYRVEETVALMVERFFDEFKKNTEQLFQNAEYMRLASLLIDYRELWRRYATNDFADLYQKTLSLLRDEVLNKAEHCTSPKALDALLAEYQLVVEEFVPEDKKKIADIRKTLDGQAKKKTSKITLMALFIAAIIAVGVCHIKRYYDAQAALGENGTPEERLDRLSAYMNSYENNFLLFGLYTDDLASVREKLTDMGGELRSTADARLKALVSNANVCARASGANDLLLEINALGEHIGASGMERLTKLQAKSEAACRDFTEVEAILNGTGIDGDALNKAYELLKTHQNEPQVTALTDAVNAASKRWREQEKAKKGEERVLELLAASDSLLDSVSENSPGYDEAQAMLRQLTRESDQRLRERVTEIEKTLQERLYFEIMHKVGGLHETNLDEEFRRLNSFIATEKAHELLSQAQKEGVAEELQKVLEQLDRKAITGIANKVSTSSALKDQLDKVATLNQPIDKYRLDGNWFVYKRPVGLSEELKKKASTLKDYETVLHDGLEVSIALKFTDDNSLGVGCGTINRDKEVTLIFVARPAGFSKTYKDNAEFECSVYDGDKGYKLDFGPVTIRPSSGRIEVIEENLDLLGKDILDDRKYSTNLSITEEDILNLYNNSGVNNPVTKILKSDITLLFWK